MPRCNSEAMGMHLEEISFHIAPGAGRDCRGRADPSLSITKQTLSREMRALGFRKLSARPRHHGRKDDAIADFKKASQASWQR